MHQTLVTVCKSCLVSWRILVTVSTTAPSVSPKLVTVATSRLGVIRFLQRVTKMISWIHQHCVSVFTSCLTSLRIFVIVATTAALILRKLLTAVRPRLCATCIPVTAVKIASRMFLNLAAAGLLFKFSAAFLQNACNCPDNLYIAAESV